MEHDAELARLEMKVSKHFNKAKKLSKKCSFWNDAGILIALISNREVLGHPSPLDNAIFPELPPHVFHQMSRQALFASLVLLAKYGQKEDFWSWEAKSQLAIRASDHPQYRIDLTRLKNPCDIWVSVMRANLSLANHRLVMKGKIYDSLFGTGDDTCMFGGSLVGQTTAKSVERYESLKLVSPLAYRFESPSQGPIHRLCNYYGSVTRNPNLKHKLAKILSFGYSLYLLARIHRMQKPEQIATIMSTDAIFVNLFDASIGLPVPTVEEQLLDTDTAQPLFFRAHESVCKLLGLAHLRPDPGIKNEVWGLFKRFVFNPISYAEPLVALPYNCVILQVTDDGCVFFDAIEQLIPSLVADRLLEGGELRKLQGEAFRSHIESIVKSHGINPFRVSKVKREGATIGDVDVGLVKDGYLCLIECKDVAPYPTLLLDEENEMLRSITHRGKGYMGWVNKNIQLQKYFQEPQNLKKLAQEKNFEPTQIKKIIGFIVTNRPVFIYLTPDMFLTSSIPRVMITDELQMLLSERWDKIRL